MKENSPSNLVEEDSAPYPIEEVVTSLPGGGAQRSYVVKEVSALYVPSEIRTLPMYCLWWKKSVLPTW